MKHNACDRTPWWMLPLTMLLLVASAAIVTAQPATPVVCEWADSLVGQNLTGGGQRQFAGNVRFRQGDVTVSCDRAVHDVLANTVDMTGNVVVRQGTLRLLAPRAQYDGNARLASGQGGVVVIDGRQNLSARRGTYSTATAMATFLDDVEARNDTLTIWSQRAWYDRRSGIRRAAGDVIAHDTVHRVVVEGDSLEFDPAGDVLMVQGAAGVWTWDPASRAQIDTLSIHAARIEMYRRASRGDSLVARGDVKLHHPDVAARAASLVYDEDLGEFHFVGAPVLWSDSAQLTADTIRVLAPERQLERVAGIGMGLLASRSDTLRPDRIDQISGDSVMLAIQQDTLREVTAYPHAVSITWRRENDTPEGVVKFAADTITATVVAGEIDEVVWLSGVAGEVHPERLVAGQESAFSVPQLRWHTDRPQALPVPQRVATRLGREK